MDRMPDVRRKLAFAAQFLRQRDFRQIGVILGTKLWYAEQAIGLMREMSLPFPAPQALIPISIRAARPEDVHRMLDGTEPGISPEERRDRASRLHLYEAGFSGCYVAVTAEDAPCFIQWLIPATENRLLHTSFGGLFPHLAMDEALLEGAYTPVAFRGQRIMPAAMALLAEKAAKLGAARALTFVGADNGASLKGCERAGFTPYITRRAVHRLGYRRTAFVPLPESTPLAPRKPSVTP